MNWLQDKKNLPILITIIVVVVLAGGGAIMWQAGLFNPPPPAAQTAPSAPPTSTAPEPTETASTSGNSVEPSTQPGFSTPLFKRGKKPGPLSKLSGPGAPGGPAAAQAAAANDPTAVLIASGPDPFHLPGTPRTSKAKDQPVAPPPPLPPLPDPLLARWHDMPVPGSTTVSTGHPVITEPTTDTSGRRMSGVLFGNGVYALLEANGKTEAVQPGDSVDGGTVVSIDATRLTLKTDNNRLVIVPLSSGE